jgi:5-methylcytosine-specific restriction enzyme A
MTMSAVRAVKHGRPNARARGYTTRWDKARLTHLAQFPLCAKCQAVGRIEPATTVDHIVPHKGDQARFWDRSNWQSLCTTHHNAAKQREERRGVQMGVDVEGRPTDPLHPWNRRA